MFIKACPLWVGADGFPLSWQHYQYGLAFHARDSLRYQLYLAQAARFSRQDSTDFNAYQSDVQRITEVPRG